MASNEAAVSANAVISESTENSSEASTQSNEKHIYQFSFELECTRPDFCYGTIIIPALHR